MSDYDPKFSSPAWVEFTSQVIASARQVQKATGHWPTDIWIGADVASSLEVVGARTWSKTRGCWALLYGTCAGIEVWGVLPGGAAEQLAREAEEYACAVDLEARRRALRFRKDDPRRN